MTEETMSVQPVPQVDEATGFICKTCAAPMRLTRVDPYAMPRGQIEILTLKCSACGSTLQQIQANNDANAMSG
jgi:hypothetical protein